MVSQRTAQQISSALARKSLAQPSPVPAALNDASNGAFAYLPAIKEQVVADRIPPWQQRQQSQQQPEAQEALAAVPAPAAPALGKGSEVASVSQVGPAHARCGAPMRAMRACQP